MQATAFPTPRAQLSSVAILGADLLLAARPASPAQLAHACMLAGFDAVVPASWGDELVAREALRQLADRPGQPAIQCSCPHVASRLLAPGPELAAFLLPIVAPPVAVARYVRGLHAPRPIHLTYVGACPAAESPEIDVRLTPMALLTALADRGIRVDELPADGAAERERGRFYSLPGGLPAPDFLARELPPRHAVEATSADYSAEVAEHLVNGAVVLLDVAPRLGCACAGARAGTLPSHARTAIIALEPPRAAASVLDAGVEVAMAQSPEQLVRAADASADVLPIIGDSSVPTSLPRRAADARRAASTPEPGAPRRDTGRPAPPRRSVKTPLGVPRMTPGGSPATGSGAPGGPRPIPRAYGLHRPHGRPTPSDRIPTGHRAPHPVADDRPARADSAPPIDEVRPIELGNESEQPLVQGVDRAARVRAWTPYDTPAVRQDAVRAGTIRGARTERQVASHPGGRGVRVRWVTALGTSAIVLAASVALGNYVAQRRTMVLTPDSAAFVTLPAARSAASATPPPATTPRQAATSRPARRARGSVASASPDGADRPTVPPRLRRSTAAATDAADTLADDVPTPPTPARPSTRSVTPPVSTPPAAPTTPAVPTTPAGPAAPRRDSTARTIPSPTASPPIVPAPTTPRPAPPASTLPASTLPASTLPASTPPSPAQRPPARQPTPQSPAAQPSRAQQPAPATQRPAPATQPAATQPAATQPAATQPPASPPTAPPRSAPPTPVAPAAPAPTTTTPRDSTPG